MPSAPPNRPDSSELRFERLLRRATSEEGLRRLLRRLGLSGDYTPVPRVALARAGIRPSVTRLVRSGGTVVPVYLARPGEDPGPELIRDLGRGFSQLRDAPFLFVLTPLHPRVLVFGCRAPDGALRFAPVERLRPRAAELLLLQELAAAPAGELARLLHWVRVLDRGSVGVRFFREIRGHRDALARAWSGLPGEARADREQLALLLLCRLLFLCFLQERGHLLGRRDFLAGLVRSSRERGGLYDAVLRPLFFEVFNTRPEQRSPAAAALGPLPYLNGGLFEPHPLERRHPTLQLPDDVLLRTFSELLDRYRFNTADPADAGTGGPVRSGIDPEVLGRVFEALMAAPRRGDTGSFYTPAAVVDGIVTRALRHALAGAGGISAADAETLITAGDVVFTDATAAPVLARLRSLRVLDPACGSGAFLLGALARIARARAVLEPATDLAAIRHDIVGRTLHGVDLLEDAALLCALRLWLALAPGAGEAVTPLPNLDRRIRQGDALLDPLDLLTPGAGPGPDRGAALAPEVRRLLRRLEALGQEYVGAEPAGRSGLRTRLREAEGSLARRWLEALRARLDRTVREAYAAAASRDLWGQLPPTHAACGRNAARLEQRLAETDALLRDLRQSAALPFFSFAVHFAAAAAGFDLVLGNPPWVRAHRWPAALAGAVRTRFRVCREAGWPGVRQLHTNGGTPGGQVDLALLFLERAVDLLAEGGTLGMLLPAKLLRSLYAGGARALLLDRVSLLELDDHSLDQHSVFAADAFTVQLLARRTAARQPVEVTLRNRGREPLRFSVLPHELPLVAGDTRAPWLLAPPAVLAALRELQRTGEPLGGTSDLTLHRGIVTGANDVLVVPAAEHKLGGLSRIRAQGWFRARRSGDGSGAHAFAGWIETACLRPLLRGADVKAWRWSTPQRLIWIPAHEQPGAPTSARTARYLARHATVLRNRCGGGRARGTGRVPHAGPALLADKVVWQDIADDLHAAAVPASVRGDDGRAVPVIALNTVYFVAAPDLATARCLAALLNSLPLRVFARAAAERAKDARFRFFAWTVAALPLPPGWRDPPLQSRLLQLSAVAHDAGGITPVQQSLLDECVAAAFGLSSAHLDALREFDAWLKR